MFRCAFALSALAVLAAGATARAQPAPRVVLDVVVTPASGLALDRSAGPGALAVGPDGTFYVLLNEHGNGSPSRVELMAIGPTGKETLRSLLPVRLPEGPSGFEIRSMGVVRSRSGDVSVFVSGRERSTLFRL